MQSFDTVVVGGGMSGLSAAYRLFKQGREVLLLEAGAEVGGAMRSLVSTEGFVLDFGPNTVTSKDPALWAEFAELGLAGRQLTADRKGGRRFVLLNGRPEPIPTDPRGLITTPLLSPLAKLRLLAEPLIPRGPTPDESIRSFFTRRIGREPAERLIDPFVSGVYAGDPAATSVRSAFPSLWAAEQRGRSMVAGMLTAPRTPRPKGQPRPRSVLFSFQNGLGEWPRAYAAALGETRVWTDSRVSGLRRVDGSWHLHVERAGRQTVIEAEHVVLATPAHVSAELLAGLDSAGAQALRAIPYAPIALVHLGYRREQVAHPLDGFGLLCPAVERRRVLGILWPSSLFPDRAPAGHVLTASFIGGARRPELAAQSEAELIDTARAEHETLLGATGTPALAHVTHWGRAIPQYVAGHEGRMAALEQLEARWPGLHLLGNYRGGVSVEKCWRNGRVLADRLSGAPQPQEATQR